MVSTTSEVGLPKEEEEVGQGRRGVSCGGQTKPLQNLCKTLHNDYVRDRYSWDPVKKGYVLLDEKTKKKELMVIN